MKDIKSLKSYKIVTEKELPEVNGTGYILEHIKTKARVLIISMMMRIRCLISVLGPHLMMIPEYLI